MDISAMNFYTELGNSSSAISKLQCDKFKNLFGELTGRVMAEEIQKNYNVTLDVGSIRNYQELIGNYEIQCTNYVSISPQTLKNMEENPALKNKIMNEIEEFCSQEEQDGIRALSPPVKSAGMIIYPDGRTLYWLEAYSNEPKNHKGKKTISAGQTIHEAQQKYDDMDGAMTENDLQNILPIIVTGYKKQDGFIEKE